MGGKENYKIFKFIFRFELIFRPSIYCSFIIFLFLFIFLKEILHLKRMEGSFSHFN